MTHTRTHRRKSRKLRKGGNALTREQRVARLAAPTIADAELPVTGETSVDVPKASVFQVAEKAAEAAADKAQDAEYAETARAKERAPLEAKRKAVETRLKSLQESMNQRRDARGRASELQLEMKANLQGQLGEIDEQLRAIGGRRKTRRRRPTRSTRRR